MTITLNHTIVAVSDRHVAARFFAGIAGLRPGEPVGPFVPVRLNDELTLDFDDRHGAAPNHYGFLVDDPTFDGIVARVRAGGVEFGSGPLAGWDRRINHLGGGRGVYVRDPDGHSYEFFTAVP